MDQFTYFPSGSNCEGEIRGFAEVGMNVGVAAHLVRERAKGELLNFPEKVFVDSGAFSEVTEKDGILYVTKPLGAEHWERILSLYVGLARELGPRLYCVGPDRVGDQKITYHRTRRYADRIRELRELGANLIIPLHKGTVDLARYANAVRKIYGVKNPLWGVPFKKASRSLQGAREVVETLHPDRLHFLGLGPSSSLFRGVKELCDSAGVDLYCDSVRVRALAGRTNGSGGGPRIITEVSERVERDLERTRRGLTPGMFPLDYPKDIRNPEAWLTGKDRREFFRNLKKKGIVPEGATRGFWSQKFSPQDRHLVRGELDRCWDKHHHRRSRAEKKRRVIVEVFKDGYR